MRHFLFPFRWLTDPRSMRRAAIVFLLALTLLATANPARAQSGIAVSDVRVVTQFGKSLQFLARVQSNSAIRLAAVTFRAESGVDQTLPLALSPDGSAQAVYDMTSNSVQPFARIQFWFDVTLTDGTVWRSEAYFFDYIDNRFTWQDRNDGVLHVHWVAGDTAFGDAALDTARGGLQQMNTVIPVDLVEPVDIWIYPSVDDLRGALAAGSQSWEAGQASPELGVALIAAAPGAQQSLDLGRSVPHELQHVLLYRRIGPNYARLPLWFREGMASLAELNPDSNQQVALSSAAADHSLIPLSDLCASFPSDPADVYLAYAESRSFTQYLLDHYGSSGLISLAASYADGLDCERGAVKALNMPLSDLDVRWREDVLGENRGGVIVANLLPYILLFVLVVAVPVATLTARVFTRRKHERDE